MRILLIEDTHDVGEGIVSRLKRTGHAVDWEIKGATALELLGVQKYDLIILDLILPDIDGLEVLENVRMKGIRAPILVITARTEINERVEGLDIGADDYLTKPFDFRELEARVRALIRRGSDQLGQVSICGDICIDRSSRSVSVGGRPVELTKRELTLLEALIARPGRVLSKKDLLDHLFGFDDNPCLSTVETYIARLRKKINFSNTYIRTLRGLGYQLVVSQDR